MIRFFLVLSGIFFSILLSVLFTGSTANAASIYDDAYQTTDTLTLYQGSWGSDIDVTTTWPTILSGNPVNEEINLVRYRNSSGFCTPNDIPCGQIESMLDDWNTNAQRWSITQQGQYEITICWTNDTSLALEWTAGAVTVVGNSVQCFKIDSNSINGWVSVRTTTANSLDRDISNPSNSKYNFLVYTDYPNYPIDYEGEEIRESPPGDSSGDLPHGQGLSPSFMYQVDDKSLILTDQTNPSLIDEYEIDLCIFQVPNNIYGDNFQEYQYDCDSPVPVTHVFDEYGSYNVLQRYYSPTNDLWYETSQVLKIDGTTYSGTAGGQADANSIFNSLMSLSVPTYGLQQALVAPIEFVGTFPSLAGVCQPINLPLPAYIGSTDDIELPCLTPVYQTYAPAFLILWQVALTALVSYAIVNKVFAKLRETYNPRSDRIEATNL